VALSSIENQLIFFYFMSSGKAHDFSIGILFLPVSISAFVLLPTYVHASFAPLIAITGYCVGGCWLSPDIDLKQSLPSKRLGFLSPLWKPYRKLSGHRGFSHMPIIGTLSRLAYILIPIIPWIAITNYNPLIFLVQNREIFMSLFLGLEASCWVHLIMDYMPFLNRN
jgi:uncharacterized metal-binding protein